MSKKQHTHKHAPPPGDFNQVKRAFYLGIGLNAFYTLVEFIIGYRTDSLALIADASHNLSDVASLLISLFGMRLAQKAATGLYTYGYKKASILASLVNAILLVFIVINIYVEGFQRLHAPPALPGKIIMLTAAIGVLINTISAFLFYKDQRKDINIKGAFLHLLADALVSVGVVISGAVMYYTAWNIMDALISFVIGAVVLFSSWGLLKESLKLILDGVPQNIDVEKVKKVLTEHPSVKKIRHLHIWALSSTQNALTVHLVLQKGIELKDFWTIKKELKERLAKENIQHATFELDEEYTHHELV